MFTCGRLMPTGPLLKRPPTDCGLQTMATINQTHFPPQFCAEKKIYPVPGGTKRYQAARSGTTVVFVTPGSILRETDLECQRACPRCHKGSATGSRACKYAYDSSFQGHPPAHGARAEAPTPKTIYQFLPLSNYQSKLGVFYSARQISRPGGRKTAPVPERRTVDVSPSPRGWGRGGRKQDLQSRPNPLTFPG
jgi:hypothetical protein